MSKSLSFLDNETDLNSINNFINFCPELVFSLATKSANFINKPLKFLKSHFKGNYIHPIVRDLCKSSEKNKETIQSLSDINSNHLYHIQYQINSDNYCFDVIYFSTKYPCLMFEFNDHSDVKKFNIKFITYTHFINYLESIVNNFNTHIFKYEINVQALNINDVYRVCVMPSTDTDNNYVDFIKDLNSIQECQEYYINYINKLTLLQQEFNKYYNQAIFDKNLNKINIINFDNIIVDTNFKDVIKIISKFPLLILSLANSFHDTVTIDLNNECFSCSYIPNTIRDIFRIPLNKGVKVPLNKDINLDSFTIEDNHIYIVHYSLFTGYHTFTIICYQGLYVYLDYFEETNRNNSFKISYLSYDEALDYLKSLAMNDTAKFIKFNDYTNIGNEYDINDTDDIGITDLKIVKYKIDVTNVSLADIYRVCVAKCLPGNNYDMYVDEYNSFSEIDNYLSNFKSKVALLEQTLRLYYLDK